MKRRPKKNDKGAKDEDNGFAAWGGYMAAKRSKLMEQFHTSKLEKLSDIFSGVAIHVNGLTNPSANNLQVIMAQHGGLYHLYQVSSTTHLIASNLPNVKINKLGSVPIVKPSWITDSVALGKLLDYKRYMLYTNQSVTQPRIDFPVLSKPPAETKTASDPNFLEEFYNNSRLHLISTLGAEFKQLVGQMREESDGVFPGKIQLESLKGNHPQNFPPHSKVIMHIDMDCFFVSVGLKKHPELRGKPIAVAHAKNPQLSSGQRAESRVKEFALYMEKMPNVHTRIEHIDALSSMSEIASCSYEARKAGVKNGMFLGTAIKLCPDLKTISYDFEGYKEVSHTLYNTIASYTLDIEAVSCDEMYVDVTDILKSSGMSVDQWATHIRSEIMQVTGCPCSTGFGANRLQARLATRKAKPAGQFWLKADDVEDYMADIPLADLPGVGRATLGKLQHLGLNTCGDVQLASLKVLQAEIGSKNGETLLEQAKGIDKKPLSFTHERKSVSAEINYGIRFKTLEECYTFLEKLSEEVFNRLVDTGLKSKCLTLKLMVRAAEAPVETAKYLGHGFCDNISKSITSQQYLNDAQIISKEIKSIYDKLNVGFADLRGIGIQLSKLEKPTKTNPVLTKFLQTKPKEETAVPQKKVENVVEDVKKGKRGRPKGGKSIKRFDSNDGGLEKFWNKSKSVENTMVPKGSEEIDLSVLGELPEDLRQEIIETYKLDPSISCNTNQKPNKAIEKPPSSKSPFTGLSWQQIKPIIRNWVETESTPSDVDALMLAEHFRSLVLQGQIDDFLKVFNFLYRLFGVLDCSWHGAYRKIVEVTQEGMQARYGADLLVERSFKCCL